MTLLSDMLVERNAPLPTWFGIGGTADVLAHPTDSESLRACLEEVPGARVIGDGANLLVDDEGVDGLTITLDHESFCRVSFDRTRVVAGAGARLPKLITACARRGLCGLETLGGIPASVGGAVFMNAGGAFGEIGPTVESVSGVRADTAEPIVLGADALEFDYRHSNLSQVIITEVVFRLTAAEPATVRSKLLEVMEYKKNSQPLADRSAGCVFKNPTLRCAVDEVGAAGQRVSAGMLIDRAGCKGMSCRGAKVSDHHANFIVTANDARAGDVISLIEQVRNRVVDQFGVTLENELVIWRRQS